MNIIRLFRWGMRAAEWAAPHIQEWHRKRHLNQTEGHRHLKAKNWSEAETHLATALNERKHSSKQRSEMLLGLAAAQRGQGKLSDAEATVRLELDLASSARNHDREMNALEELGEIQLLQGNHAAAQSTAESILTKEGSQGRPNKARLATSSRRLGKALMESGMETEALAPLEKAAKYSEEGFGEKHVETARCLSDLGGIYLSMGKHAEAQQHLRRAVDMHRALSGADSHEATQSLFLLASSLVESGDPDTACGEFERVLTIKDRQVGGNPEETIDTQLILSKLYLQAGRISAARELLLGTIGVVERKGGERLVTALELLAEAEQRAGRKTEAARWRDKLNNLGQAPAKPDLLAQFGRASTTV